MISFLKKYLGGEESLREIDIRAIMRSVNANPEFVERAMHGDCCVLVYLVDTPSASWSSTKYKNFVHFRDCIRSALKSLDNSVNVEVLFRRINMDDVDVAVYSDLLTLSPEKVRKLHETIGEEIIYHPVVELHEDPSVMKVCVFPAYREHEGGAIMSRVNEKGRDVNDYIVMVSDNLHAKIVMHYLGHSLGLVHVRDEEDIMYADGGACPSKVKGRKFGRESKRLWNEIRRFYG